MADVLVKKCERKNDTVWEYRFEVAAIDGKRQWISKSGFKTKSAAKEAGKQAQKLYEQTGVATKPTDMSFADFLDYWIENRCRLVCKEVTVAGYEKKILAVNRQVQWYSNKKIGRGGNRREESDYGYWYFTEPKYRSYRTIDLDNETCELLKREHEKQLRAEEYYGSFNHFTRYYSDEPLIFGDVLPNLPPSPMNKIGSDVTEQIVAFVCRREDGSYISPRTLQHTSSVIHKQIDFKEFDFHSLRHTHTTMLIENGAPPVYVQNRLGHKNLDTTMNIYANHMTEAFKQQGNSILNNMY